jgi:alkanesulfonate monooxygenase SsuD/methylene tetrahydromethanopterin reductase-like flavin-dependent oxidoreductase (luciferase family)
MSNTQFKLDPTRPLYAVVGAGEAAVEFARDYVEQVQTRWQKIEKVDLDPKALREQARALVIARVEELNKDAKRAQTRATGLQSDLSAQVSDLPTRAQKLVDEYLTELSKGFEELTKSYEQLAARGKEFVAKARGTEIVVTVEPTAAPTVVSKPATKKATAKKPAAKKAPAKKAASKKA